MDYLRATRDGGHGAGEEYTRCGGGWMLRSVEADIIYRAALRRKSGCVQPTVAEKIFFRGTEKPDEVVIIGAALGSWVCGTGATGKGTGIDGDVLEAARGAAKISSNRKRTIRFVGCYGRREGGNGSKGYVNAHKR